MKKISIIISTVIASFGLFALASFVSPSPAFACSGAKDCITQGVNGAGDTGGGGDINSVFKKVVEVLLFLIGAVSVIMIVVGGIKYTTSGGDSAQVTSAKNTIMYAVVGLIVALLGYAIVNFVVKAFAG